MRVSCGCFVRVVLLGGLLFGAPGRAESAEWFVRAGANGTGTAASPFGAIQHGMNAAQPGDVVTVAPGTYRETLRTVRHATETQRIVLRAASGRGSVVVSMAGRVLSVAHNYFTVEGLVLDGEYGDADILKVETNGHGFVLRNSEVRRTSRDAIDMAAPHDVLIEGSLIHHALNATNGRTDAHGIVGGAVRRLTIRGSEIHTFSGDGVQVDPARSSPGWNDVVIEDCRIWLAPLPAAVNGFAAGIVPGENAVDTKADSSLARARITIRNTEAFGFRAGLSTNMAAFLIKEHVDAVIDAVTVHGSEVAFRVREPARVLVQNSVVHSVATAVRYEDNIQDVRLWNMTLGRGVSRIFQAASSSGSMLDVRNLLVLGSALPAQASHPSNLAVSASAFVDAAQHNYQLVSGSPAIDRGTALSGVTHDRLGNRRPQGPGFDIGAYEHPAASAPDGNPEIVLHAWRASPLSGNWSVVPDVSAAGGARMASADLGAINRARAEPSDYFDLEFFAEAGQPYRVWVRGRAEGNLTTNDSLWLQFSDSLNAKGVAAYRIGTTSAAKSALQACSSCEVAGWGWMDGPKLFFETTGQHTLRVQTLEDGLSVDQIVVSPARFLKSAPGSGTSDTTLLPESGS